MNVQIESASAEPVDITLIAATDPTASPPAFQVTAATVTTPAGAWSNGSWLTTWDTTGRLKARTPTVGAAGTLVVVEGSEYTLWVKWGTVVKRAGTITVL
jgi:hypothetical protein